MRDDEKPARRERHLLMAGIVFFAILGMIGIASGGSYLPGAPNRIDVKHNEPAKEVTDTIIDIFGGWVERNKDAVDAFSTLLVATFTFTLWRATVLLFRAGERQLHAAVKAAEDQSANMQDSIKAAVKAAVAMEAVARSSYNQAVAMQSFVAAAQRTASATEESVEVVSASAARQFRAYIFVEILGNIAELQDRWRTDDGVWLNWSIALRNYGNTPAMIKSITVYHRRPTAEVPEPLRNPSTQYNSHATNVLISPYFIIPPEGYRPFLNVATNFPRENDIEARLVMSGELKLWFQCRVDYEDIMGNARITHICIYPGSHNAEEYGGITYNYRT